VRNDSDTIKAVILDWSGTSVDFGSIAPVDALLETFALRGINITKIEAREPMGLSQRDHIRKILRSERVSTVFNDKYGRLPDEEDVCEFYDDFKPLLREKLRARAEPIDGILNAVADLRKIGVKIGSTTAYSREMMDVLSSRAGELGYSPDVTVTPDDVPLGRPAPYMIFRNMERLMVYPPGNVVKVGDTLADIGEGRNAGVWSVGVTVGGSVLGLSSGEYASLSAEESESVRKQCANRFYEAGADYVIESIEKLPELIERINGEIALNGSDRGVKR
jgi:phosphonoacetaldehyde hydrolase